MFAFLVFVSVPGTDTNPIVIVGPSAFEVAASIAVAVPESDGIAIAELGPVGDDAPDPEPLTCLSLFIDPDTGLPGVCDCPDIGDDDWLMTDEDFSELLR